MNHPPISSELEPTPDDLPPHPGPPLEEQLAAEPEASTDGGEQPAPIPAPPAPDETGTVLEPEQVYDAPVQAPAPALASYLAVVAQHARPGPTGARYHEYLFQALYNATRDAAAMNEFLASLSSAEHADLDWWLDLIFHDYDLYQRFVNQTMEQVRQKKAELNPDGDAGDAAHREAAAQAAKALMSAAAPRIKSIWQHVLGELWMAYAFRGRPYGPNLPDLQRWASESAAIRRTIRHQRWQQFLHDLGLADTSPHSPPPLPPQPDE